MRTAFLAVLLVSLANGGATVANFTGNLQSIDAAAYVDNRIETDVSVSAVADRRVTLAVRISNPTGLAVRLDGAHVRIHNQTDKRLASGAGRRVDDRGDTIPAGGTLTATYDIRVSPEQRGSVRAALERGARVTVRLGLNLRETRFTVVRTSTVTVEAN